MDENAEPFSKLEAGFAEIEFERRPVSVHVEAINRFANASDHLVKDLDFNFNAEDDSARISVQSMLPALQYNLHVENTNNFATNTQILCFDHTEAQTTFSTVDDVSIKEILNSIQPEDATDAMNCDPSMTGNLVFNTISASTGPTAETVTSERLLVFFVPIWPNKDGSFGSQASIKSSCVEKLFKTLDVNPEYLLNLVGRPDYWSPRTRWRRSTKDRLVGVDYFCQYPRWNVLAQGAPLSLYVTRRLRTKLTAYILSHKPGDTSISALQQMLKIVHRASGTTNLPTGYLRNPFEIAVLLSTLSLEASKFHVGRFRRYMWQQINKVDDHLSGLDIGNRDQLTELTKSLQIISQQADSHLLNADVAILTARGTKLRTQLNMKDGTMSLVYNLVTQNDAQNNILLSRSMKRDSASMSAIAALTMVFLPGTFTSSILSAGIFSANAGSRASNKASKLVRSYNSNSYYTCVFSIDDNFHLTSDVLIIR
ncbi:uncharacterized protein LMH87_008086 [Akanthomyces muscarius]|uniref:Uncharacterized protein n=1 Tax=Akanthomyces muscarius TaxID=2231603 RepID=A0A9W8QKY9_AKAMU|nr:uncharacterized protein LMH87_008086 [Akanthomyces muscarius]KAJ4159175.1 hypothetical protein LMH87_008086 [Akanthomyces muscarius]